MNYSFAEENYLKALFHLEKEAGEVNVNILSKSLRLKMPTVTSMMKKLSEKKLVHYQSYKPLRLTEKGKKEAGLIIRKHRLTEMFLVEKMEFGWEEVHEIAEQVEHIDSSVFFDRMDELMGHPSIDPHGSPIPDKNGRISRKPYQPLGICKAGETVRLAALLHSSSDFLKFLNSRDLTLGTALKIKSVEPYDNSMVVAYKNRDPETLSEVVCRQLLVERLKP